MVSERWDRFDERFGERATVLHLVRRLAQVGGSASFSTAIIATNARCGVSNVSATLSAVSMPSGAHEGCNPLALSLSLCVNF